MAAAAYFLVFFILSHLLLLHSAEKEPKVKTKCPSFYCGNAKENMEHPEIGYLTVDNCIEQVQKIQLKMRGELYDVKSIFLADTIDFNSKPLRDTCHRNYSDNFNFPLSPYLSFKTTFDQNQLKCNLTHPLVYFSYVSSPICGFSSNDSQGVPSPQCLSSHPAINITHAKNGQLFSLSAADIFFQVQVNEFYHRCYFKGVEYKGGKCTEEINGTVQCTNEDEDKGNHKMGLKLLLGITVAAAAGIGVLIFIFCCFLGKFSSNKSMVFWRKETPNHQNVEVFLRNYRFIFPKRYSYSDVKKMTSSFKDKLGQGGYGGVYKGKLLDGCLVAVKVLNKSKDDGQEFVNEVASISRTSHVNIVTLLGFCFEGSQRALIYEFMPNRSLEKFIYEKNTLRENRQLGWETLYQIAIGIARGLEYLHGGCNTRILHFDIKPHNILLNQDFCPKISDFGLAKLCPKNESIISMTGARGTAGYIAPEVFCRNFGGVSHKSDVYSYGMMILEMVGGRKNIDVGVEHSSEMYFPHWIYKRLEQSNQLGLHGLMNEEENERARKMILVGLWCIQSDPSNRPPIGRVVDMLQGSLGSLQIPPCPVLSSPSKSQVDSLNSSVMAL